MHCRACQKWLFLAASQWFINSFISCLANISRVLSNPGRLDTLLFLIFSSLLEFFASLLLCNGLVTSGICVRSRCAAQPELSASVKGGLYCLFIFVLRVLCGVTDVVFFLVFFVYSYVLISSVGQPCYISEITGKRRRERLLIRRKRNRERCI